MLNHDIPGIRDPLPQEKTEWQVVKPRKARRAAMSNPPRTANSREPGQGYSKLTSSNRFNQL